MNKLTITQALNIAGTIVFLLLGLLFMLAFNLSKHSISASSDFTLTLMNISIVMFMIDVVFVILTIRSFMYPNHVEEKSTASFDDLFVD